MANPNSPIQTQRCATEAATEAAGVELAARLGSGDVVVLGGPLGAGKTRFVKGLAAGLGCGETVASPTYAIVNEYFGSKGSVYHFDFYRLESSEELRVIGLTDYLETGICLIEWGEKFLDALPPAHWQVQLEPQPDGSRQIQIQAP